MPFKDKEKQRACRRDNYYLRGGKEKALATARERRAARRALALEEVRAAGVDVDNMQPPKVRLGGRPRQPVLVKDVDRRVAEKIAVREKERQEKIEKKRIESESRVRLYGRNRVPANPDRSGKRKIDQAAYKLKTRTECFDAYGGAFCVCCGEENMRFLTLDHVNNDGGVHRHAIGKRGMAFLFWLRKQGFPDRKSYQVLCFNCNQGKFFNGGICPHEQESKKLLKLIS